MRLVLDTNIVVSAALSPFGPPARVLDSVLAGAHILLTDDRILHEYREVLSRPKFNLSRNLVDDLMEFFLHGSERIFAPALSVEMPDESDRMFLEVAMDGRADFLITGNAKHFPRSSVRGPRIVSPADFLKV